MTRVRRSIVIPLTLVLTVAVGAVNTVNAVAAPTPPKLRLDDAARPTHYTARVTVDPAQPTFKGAIDIDVKVARATDVLWLNGVELTVDKAAFTVGGETTPAK